VSLTTTGDVVVNYARRLLSLNDQILDLAGPRPDTKTIRIGATGDFAAAGISQGLIYSRMRRPDLRFTVQSSSIDLLLKDLREGAVDIVVWVSTTGPVLPTALHWTEELVWVRAPATQIEPDGPVPLVSYGEECGFTRSALGVLGQANRACELTYVGSSVVGIAAAVAAGFGVTVLPRNRAGLPGVVIWEDAPLPKLPQIFSGIYVRDGTEAEDCREVAEQIAEALRPQPVPIRQIA
jgi:DNA-binding transcriptional LysR family regulator